MPEPGALFAKQILKHCLRGNFAVLDQFRYYSRWKGSLVSSRTALHDHCPWLTFHAIDFLKDHLPGEARVFEYGGGGSTLFFLDRGNSVVTVEHDPAWFGRLSREMEPGMLANWEGHLIPPEMLIDNARLDKAEPGDYYSGNNAYRQVTFKGYSTFINRYEDEHFDLVLVDGRARSSCVRQAIPKVKTGGWLVLDNSERSYYLVNNRQIAEPLFRVVLDKRGAVPYDTYFSRTTIWQKS